MQIIRRSSFKSVPWKNGGGITHEAMRAPASGDPFRWRVSVAQVETSGPFSDFSGYHRTMVLLEGAGVRLRFANGAQHTLRAAGDLIEFDGALAVDCQLIDGPCVDLNLIAADALPEVRARVERVRGTLALQPAPGRIALAFALDAALEISSGHDRGELRQWDLAVLAAELSVELRAAQRAAAVFLADLPA